MDSIFEKQKLKNINILNRIPKKFSTSEFFLNMKKQYFTNNIFYYFLCVLFRFIHLILFCGDYYYFFNKDNAYFKKYLKVLTCFNIIQRFHISFTTYIIIILIISILIIIRILLIAFIIKLNISKNGNIWPMPNTFHIIIEHIVFLLLLKSFPFRFK